jgi:hypothetical protein
MDSLCITTQEISNGLICNTIINSHLSVYHSYIVWNQTTVLKHHIVVYYHVLIIFQSALLITHHKQTNKQKRIIKFPKTKSDDFYDLTYNTQESMCTPRN